MRRPTRREARIARQSAAKLRNVEKSARFRERPGLKEVRIGADPTSIYQMHMTWSCDDPDREGAWESGTPRDWEDDVWTANIEPKLGHWSGLTWGEIDAFSSDKGHKMHHGMDVDVITREAQHRLMVLDKYFDTIFRFRLGNRRRLWGFRILANFDVLWFDPEHEIYPTDPS